MVRTDYSLYMPSPCGGPGNGGFWYLLDPVPFQCDQLILMSQSLLRLFAVRVRTILPKVFHLLLLPFSSMHRVPRDKMAHRVLLEQLEAQ